MELRQRQRKQHEQMVHNLKTHALQYPGPELEMNARELDLSPCTARELVLLADLAGWEAFVPAMLDMATRPDDADDMNINFSWRWSDVMGYRTQRMWGAFRALQILQSECHL